MGRLDQRKPTATHARAARPIAITPSQIAAPEWTLDEPLVLAGLGAVALAPAAAIVTAGAGPGSVGPFSREAAPGAWGAAIHGFTLPSA
jgi:hypothetical protein